MKSQVIVKIASRVRVVFLVSPLVLVLLLALFPGVGAAENDPAKAAAEKDLVALSKLAATKRAAVVSLGVEWAPGRVQPFMGAFISDDGLALVSLAAFARPLKPLVMVAGKKRVEFGKILGVFPEEELALIKLKHRPKTWLELAPREPELGETLALVPLKQTDLWTGELPPVIGPIMAKRRTTTSNLRVPRFARALSLGSYISPAQRAGFSPGCFAVDGKGRLVAVTAGIQTNRSQTMILLTPVVGLAEKIRELAKGGKDLGPRLPKALNPTDLALLDDDFRDLHLAIQQRNQAVAQLNLKLLLERYPDSFMLRVFAATEPLLIDLATPFAGLGGLAPDPEQPAAQQVALFEARAVISLMREDMDGAIRELKAATNPEISPIDFPRQRTLLASLYLQAGRLDEAEPLFREAYPFELDSIDFLDSYRSLLLKKKNWDQLDIVEKRIEVVEETYRRR